MPKEEEQLEFEGMRVAGTTFKLKAFAGLTREAFKIGDVVGGEWKGEVVSVHHDREDPGIIRTAVIVVTKATAG